jgi:hypothetical protein
VELISDSGTANKPPTSSVLRLFIGQKLVNKSGAINADNTTQTKKQSANYHDYQQQTEQIYKTNWHRSVYTAKTVEHQAEQDSTAQTFP